MMSFLTIIIIVVSIVIALLMIQLLIKNRLYKEIDQLQLWKNEIKNKPVADELKRVKDLNLTGQTEELFEKWRNEWDEMITNIIPQAEKELQDAEAGTSQFSFRKVRYSIHQAGVFLAEAEKRIEDVLTELQELMESYEKNNTEIEQHRNTYRELKKNVLAYRHTFTLAERKLEELLDEEQKKFQLFQEATDKGNYLEARDIVKTIEQGISFMQDLLQQIPTLQTECQTNMPTQLEDLLQGYEQMKKQGYVLNHLEIPKEVRELRIQLQHCLDDIKDVNIEDAKQHIELIKSKIDTLYDQLENEVTAKYYVEKDVDSMNETLNNIKIQSLETKEETQFVKQSYQLSDEDVEVQKYVEKQVNVLTKRFDTLQLKIADQDIAFSVIREELQDIRRQMDELKELHSQYKDMIQSLRKDEFEARESLQQMRKTLIETKRVIQKSNLPGLPEETLEGLKRAQVAVQRVYEQLEQKPLNMGAVNGTLEEAETLVTNTYEFTNEMVHQANLVEKLIQYGNRYRSQNDVVSSSLYEAEKLFRQYKYKASLEQAAAILEKVEPGVVQKIEEFMTEE
ncbi:septation ring formation regulator EzrA [Ectobacillus polymachus]|uniref:septation ring formation regulator EzrA n=1 Tax=Ectobacillus polymachus TaxID=1508806 RepID=UPI003A87D48E